LVDSPSFTATASRTLAEDSFTAQRTCKRESLAPPSRHPPPLSKSFPSLVFSLVLLLHTDDDDEVQCAVANRQQAPRTAREEERKSGGEEERSRQQALRLCLALDALRASSLLEHDNQRFLGPVLYGAALLFASLPVVESGAGVVVGGGHEALEVGA